MNRISFKGSHGIVGSIVSLIFGAGPRPGAGFDGRRAAARSSGGDADRSPAAAAAKRGRFEQTLRGIAHAGSIDPECLEILFDFFIACGVTDEKLDHLTGARTEALVSLARDIETLRRYRRDGTIIDVRIVDEWPF